MCVHDYTHCLEENIELDVKCISGVIFTFILLNHVCILSLDPVSAVDVFMNELTESLN